MSTGYSVGLPKQFSGPFDRLRNELLAAANSYPGLNLSLIVARRSAPQMLDGPPAELWRGNQPIVWSEDIPCGDLIYRFVAWGEGQGLKRFDRLTKTANRLLDALPDDARRTVLSASDHRLGWLGLVEGVARTGKNPILSTSRATWDGRQLLNLDMDGRVILRSGKHRMHEVFDVAPDYFISLVEPDVFSASAYLISELLGDAQVGSQVVVVQPVGAALRGVVVKKKRSRRPTRLTNAETEAWAAFQEEGTYTAAARKLGISRQALSKRVKSAKAKIGTPSRSVRAKHKLPEDKRGQTMVFGQD